MKELTLEQVDMIYPMIDAETKPTSPTALSFRLACAQAKRLYPQHGGGGLLVGALVIGNGYSTWGEFREAMDIKKIDKEHLVPVMEANPDFLPLPAVTGGDLSLERNGENLSSEPSQS